MLKNLHLTNRIFSVFIFFSFYRDILCVSIDYAITIADLQADMREVCSFPEEQEFTMKWVDEEGEWQAPSTLGRNLWKVMIEE